MKLTTRIPGYTTCSLLLTTEKSKGSVSRPEVVADDLKS
jgi:hypothetical protein